MGNCGYTLAPVHGDDQDYLMGLFSAAEEVPKAALQRFAPFSWQTFPDYLEWLQRSPLGLNVLTQVGHSAVRRYVMGADALERAATDDEIASIVQIVEEALDAGAAGVSTSQAPHQVGELGEHIPSYFAADAETEALAAAVRRRESGCCRSIRAPSATGCPRRTRRCWSSWRRSRGRWCRGTTSA